jgi:hypothetical protein
MQLSNKPWKQNNGEQISSSPTRTTAATQTGIPDLDKLLSSRQLDVSAKKLADFISKRKTDRRTVWQGLPGILSTIFGGGIGNNKHSWLMRYATLACGRTMKEIKRYKTGASSSHHLEYDVAGLARLPQVHGMPHFPGTDGRPRRRRRPPLVRPNIYSSMV